VLGIGRRTFYDHLRDDPDLQAVLDRGRDTGRATLRRPQWQRAEAGTSVEGTEKGISGIAVSIRGPEPVLGALNIVFLTSAMMPKVAA
jgi:hypothetical protein